MLSFFRRNTLLSILAVTSLSLYLIDYFIVGDAVEIVTSLIGNLAFLPIYVIFVTLMIEQIMRERERQTVLRKLNMVIGVFFSEVGNRLLKELSVYVITNEELHRQLLVTPQWHEENFKGAHSYLKQNDPAMDCTRGDVYQLKEFLVSRRGFLVGLLENQNLLEHERFSDLLWAVFHLVEELEARRTFENMPKTDLDHISGDMKRVYGYLTREWLSYMQHLKNDYPYLFSLAVRLNPMVDNPDPHVY